MKVAVVGGGINGVMCAWALAKRGCAVELYESHALMSATSSSSTKLLHGGLRYLERGQVRLVRESLHERRWWMEHAPHLVRQIEINLPIYDSGTRGRWKVGIGLALYDFLAGKESLGKSKWLTSKQMLRSCPSLRPVGLAGAYVFPELQMDDQALGLWAAEQARVAGVTILEQTSVERISTAGEIYTRGERHSYDRAVNVAGPWAKQLLAASGIASKYDLDLVRGSHLVLEGKPKTPLMLEHPRDGRPCFVLPYRERTLVGTTEVRQNVNERIGCSDAERDYLLALYEHYLPGQNPNVVETFAGLRPLLRSNASSHAQSRESTIEQSGNLVNVFGGKWTTAHALGEKVADAVLR